MDRSTKPRGNRIPYGTPETFHSIQISFLKTSFDRIPWRSSRAFDNREAFCDRAWSTGTLVCSAAIRFVEQSAVRLVRVYPLRVKRKMKMRKRRIGLFLIYNLSFFEKCWSKKKKKFNRNIHSIPRHHLNVTNFVRNPPRKKKKKERKRQISSPTMAKFTQSPMERSDVGLPY